MTLFIALAAALVLAALAVVLRPLLKTVPAAEAGNASTALSLRVLREQLAELETEHRTGTLDAAQYEKERGEIERRAIEDGSTSTAAAASDSVPAKKLAAGMGAMVIALTAGLYVLLGTPEALKPGSTQQQNAHAVTPQQIQTMVARLAERLQENPADAEGWIMLARSYGALGRFPEAAAAFGRATSLMPDDAQTLSDYADTLAMAQGRRLAGEPEKIIRRALQADPRNVKALALAGSAAFERQDYSGAVAEWRKILELVPPDSNIAERIQNSIADAESHLGKGPVPANVAKPVVSGVVSIDSKLREKVADNDTVFVFARAPSGPGMPLAILRLRVQDLPARFALDDSMAIGAQKLSSQTFVVVGARVSRSGDATPRPGDLEGFSDPVAPGSQNVRIAIARLVP